MASGVAGWPRRAVVAAGAFFIASIGISRVLIHAHSLIEVVVGSIIGLVALGVFAHAFWRRRPAEPRLQMLVVTCVGLMVLLNGENLRAEGFLQSLGVYLNHVGLACF